MDSLCVLQILRDEGLKIPVLVITADIQETPRQECLNLGASGVMKAVMKKVLNPDALRRGIQIALGAKEIAL
jgi:CheY-like chemotaxis protein